MPRRSLDGKWEASPVVQARLDAAARGALHALEAAWGCSTSAVIRRTLVEAADRDPAVAAAREARRREAEEENEREEAAERKREARREARKAREKARKGGNDATE